MLMGLAAGGWGGPARAREARPGRRITVIMGIGREGEGEDRLQALRKALAGFGWHLDDQLGVSVEWVEGDPANVARLARQALDEQPDLIVATATPIAVELRRQGAALPVVFVNLVDPLGAQLVASFAAPGTNFTGLTNTEPALTAKWLELLKELAPKVSRVGFLFHPGASPVGTFRRALDAAAQTLDLSILDCPVTEPGDIDPAVARCDDHGSTGMVVMTDLFTSAHHKVIVGSAMRYGVPGAYPYRFFAASGGLLSYSADLLDLYARAAQYVDRILKGAAPAELPVQMPSKYELVVNLRAASSLGLTIPATIAARTDEFIE